MISRPLFRSEALQKLSWPDQLDQAMCIIAPRDWLLLLAVILMLGGILIWAIFSTLEITIETQGYFVERPGVLEVVLYLPLTDAVNVSSGMPVYLAPGGISTITYGYLKGQINDLVRTSDDAQTMLAYVRLEETSDGLHWTRGHQPAMEFGANTPTSAIIVIDEIHPIEVLFRDATR